MGERASFAELVPEDRFWVLDALCLGFSFLLLLYSMLGLLGFEYAWVPAAAVSFCSVLSCVFRLQCCGVICADRVMSSSFLVAGALGLGVAAFPPSPSLAVAAALCVALLRALRLVLMPKRDLPARLSLDAENRALLTKPLAYLLACIVSSSVASGALMVLCEGALDDPMGFAGLSVGLLVTGVTLWGMMAATKPSRGLDWITRSALSLLFAALLFFFQSFAPVASLAVLAFSLSLIAFLLARMTLDLLEVFDLPSAAFVVAIVVAALLHLFAAAASIALKAMGLDRVFAAATTLAALAMAAVVVYGLSSERIWTASELRAKGEAVAAPEPPSRGAWRQACALIADEAGLTPREREVFELLAKGRNVPSISRELVISSHTAKTHTLSIYRKTGVHSAQELIDLVESAKDRARK